MALGTILASSAYPQVLAGTILLPDSLGPLPGATCVALDENPGHPRMFVGSDSGDVLVVDSRTGERVARMETGPVRAICYSSAHNKLYMSLMNSYDVVVLDCSTYETIAELPIGRLVSGLLYNPIVDRVYCAMWGMKVIDCATDSIVDSLPISGRNAVFALDTMHNKLYVGATDTFRVVDCDTNSIVASLYELRGAQAVCFAPSASGGKVYVGVDDTLFAVSVKTDTVVYRRELHTAGPIVCDPEHNRIYFGAYGGVCVAALNCAYDSVVWVYATGGDVIGFAIEPTQDKVYALTGGSLYVLDGGSGQWLQGFGYFCSGLYRSALLNRLFLTSDGEHNMRSIDCNADTVVSVIPYGAFVGFLRGSVCVDTADNKLYYSAGASGVGVVDCATNKVTSYVSDCHLRQTTGPPSLAYRSRGDKLYVRVGSSLFVFDCKADTLLKVIPVGAFSWASAWQMDLNPNSDKLYVLAGSGNIHQLVIVDCDSDSVRQVIVLPYEQIADAFLSPELNQLWLFHERGYTVVDCIGDSVLADSESQLECQAACYAPSERKVYAASFSDLYVIDMETWLLLDSLSFSPTNQGWTRQVYCARQAGKVYWVSENDQYMQESDSVFSVDTRTDSVVSRFTVPWLSLQTCDDRTGNYVYFASASGYLVAVDTRTDSIVSGVHIPLRAKFLVPDRSRNRFYVVGQNDTIIQAISDSIIYAGVRTRSGSPTRAARLQTVLSRGVPLRSLFKAALFNAAGSVVALLKDGPNDISSLSPGVYFVQEEPQAAGSKLRAVRKVVVAK